MLLAGCKDKTVENPQTLAQCNCEVHQCISLQTRKQQLVTITGTATISNTQLFGKPYNPHTIKLDRWLCTFGDPSLPDSDPDHHGTVPVKEIQLVGPYDKEQFLENLTRHVQLSGIVFLQSSPWHITPVVFIPETKLTPAP